jgi:pimeloyl-ACP methyl ester carboxylesterase
MSMAEDAATAAVADGTAPDGANRRGESIFVTAQDGLKLHARHYGVRTAPGTPVVCLPGLARTVADFEDLALALAANDARPRRIVAVDYRGRGLSDYDRTPANYNLAVELSDLLAVLTALEIGPAVMVGSSRGGILAMLLAAARPTAIAGVVLHDIGPVIEPKGLMRLKSYVGKLPQPRSFEEGAEIMRRLFDAQFPKFGAEQWLAAARRTWIVRDGRMAPNYDVKLSRTLSEIDLERPLPPMWNEFDALARVPMLVIRGANSDILSAATLTAMAARRSKMESIEVPDQGHVPVLAGADLLRRISDFIKSCEP